MLQAGQYAGMRLGYWPAAKLQAEIELEIGSRDSLLRALSHLQPFCHIYLMLSDRIIAENGLIKKVAWYKPRTWIDWFTRRGEVEVGPKEPILLHSSALLMQVAGNAKRCSEKLYRCVAAPSAGYRPIDCCRCCTMASCT